MTLQTLRLSDLRANLGKEVAVSDWFPITQERINAFAEVGEDRQWIHIDPERARDQSLYGGAIAHGFLTLSLISHLRNESMRMEGAHMSVNYGFNRLRFTAPVPAGSRIRARFALSGLEEFPGGVQTAWHVTVEREGGDKPVLVAEWLTRHYG